jgi:hypothetical protein
MQPLYNHPFGWSKKIASIFLLLLTFGCVDRVFFDIRLPDEYGISIGGYISDLHGPYTVRVFRTYDVESNQPERVGVSAKVTLSDDKGNSEELTQVTSGVYQTNPDKTKGVLGGIYKVNIQLGDGRVYESLPDTLREGARLDSTYYNFTNYNDINGAKYQFDIYANSSLEKVSQNTHLMWWNKTAFKSDTHPEREPGACYRIPSEGKCNFVDPCSGLKNIGNDFEPVMVRVKPCECCTCWYEAFTSKVILNDKLGSNKGVYDNIRIDRIPLNGYMMMYKMRIEANVASLSTQAFRFWKSVRDQETAVSNIFQPITGHIPGNIVQIEGNNSNEPAQGLFYATSITNKYFYITRNDIDENIIPSTNFTNAGQFPCYRLFPNASNTPPLYWVE